MSFPQPNMQAIEQIAKRVEAISERVIDLNEEVAFNDYELKDAYENIEKIVVATNTSEQLELSVQAMHDSTLQAPELDTSGFDLERSIAIQKQFNIIFSRMSYTFDVADWFQKSIKQTEILRQLVLQQMPGQAQGQVQVVVKQKGWWTRTLESIGVIDDDEVTTRQETVDYITAKFRQIQLAEDMLEALQNEYEEYKNDRITFGRKAMGFYILGFLRNLHTVERVSLGVLDKGFRLHMQETARDLNSLVQSMSQTSSSLMAAQNPALPAPGNGQAR